MRRRKTQIVASQLLLRKDTSTDLLTLARVGKLNETISGKQFRDGRIEVTGNPPCLPSPSNEYRSPNLGAAERLAGVAGAGPAAERRHCSQDTALARKMART